MCCLFFVFVLSGPVLVTAEGGAHGPRHGTGVVHAHAPGRGGGGIAVDPVPAAEATVTATSRAPDTSKDTNKASQQATTEFLLSHNSLNKGIVFPHCCSFFVGYCL